MEAAEIAGSFAVQLPAVRQAFSTQRSSDRMMAGRLAGTEGGAEAVQALERYSERLHLHRSSGAETSVEIMTGVVESILEATGETPFLVVDYLQTVSYTHLT